MKRISILCAVLVMFVLGSSAALAKGPKEGKGKPDTARAQAEKGKGKVSKEAEGSEEKVKAEKEKAEKKAKAAKEKAEKAKEQSEEADDDDKAAGKGKGKSAAAKGKGKGKGQQGAARAKQIEHEAQKHETRKARLEEMLKVAEGKGDDKAVARIQKLIDREQGRFEKKNKKMTERGSKEAGDEVDEDGADENEDDE
ncbi:MAG: hypothetical protein ACYSN8_05770 [Planctomycetota bacterium]